MYSALGLSAGYYGLLMTGSGVRPRVLWLDGCGWEGVEAGKEERGVGVGVVEVGFFEVVGG